jgi:hypothetical protein
MFCIESNSATVCLQGTHAIRFFQLLDPCHVPPHRIAFMRITHLLEQAIFREYQRIVNDNALLYGTDFASTNSDFYTNKERRETYGCLVANILSQQYVFKVSPGIVCWCSSKRFLTHTVCDYSYSSTTIFTGWTTCICQQQVLQRRCQGVDSYGGTCKIRLGNCDCV